MFMDAYDYKRVLIATTTYFDTMADFLDVRLPSNRHRDLVYSYDIIFTPECEHSLVTHVYLLSPSGTECDFSCRLFDEAKSPRCTPSASKKPADLAAGGLSDSWWR
jgi:hypothetical protein